jgi:hypothetical protein
MRRLTSSSALPLTLAIQGTALTVLGMFLASPPSSEESAARAGSGDLPRIESPPVTELEIPRDLRRERLPVPRLPDPEEPRKEPAPKPSDNAPEAPMVDGSAIAALRVESVALASLVAIDTPLSLPNAPDRLDLHAISGGTSRSWLAGSGKNRRGAGPDSGPSDTGSGGSGWGGSGYGGSGGGSGGNCPTPGGGRIGGGGGSRGRPGGTGVTGTSGGGGGSQGTPAGSSGGRPGSGGGRTGGDRPGGSGRKN